MDNKERFIELLQGTQREGIDKVIVWLEKHNFFEDPASTMFHNAHRGGLVEHSLTVFDELCKIYPNAADPIEFKKLIIVALLHDTCKAGTYKVDFRNVKNDKGTWEKVPYFAYNSDGLPFGHGEKSVIILQQMIKLSVEEALAIRWHMGAYEPKENWNALQEAQKLYPLVCYINFADVLAARKEDADAKQS